MELQDVVQDIKRFLDWPHTDKIKLFGWYFHTYRSLTEFMPRDIGACFDELNMDRPSNIARLLTALTEKKPREALKNKNGYRLEKRVRDSFDKKYGQRTITVAVTQLLKDLPGNIPDLAERTYLDEALLCFKVGAFRAAIVMTWNLAYHHLCDHVLKKHLPAFNARWLVRYPKHHKSGSKTIARMDDFGEDLNESQVLEICKSASIVTNDIYKILSEKLGRRNSAAHPSNIKMGQLQAEDYISDLVENVVLKL